MLIVILVTLTETSADIIAVGEIVGTKVDSKRIGDGLRADMLSSAISPLFNSFTQSAFAQNVGLVAITGVKSRFVVSAGGLILVVLGLLPVLGRVVAAVPTPVLGGAGVVLFGTVAASGIRTLSKVEYQNNMNLIIVAASIGFGMIPIAAPAFYDQFPSWFSTIFHSGISSAAVMAILLNLLFNHLKAGNSENQSVFVAGTGRMVTEEDLQVPGRRRPLRRRQTDRLRRQGSPHPGVIRSPSTSRHQKARTYTCGPVSAEKGAQVYVRAPRGRRTVVGKTTAGRRRGVSFG